MTCKLSHIALRIPKRPAFRYSVLGSQLSLQSQYFICTTIYCSMRYVSAYLLAVLGGNESPSAADLKNILDSVGIEVDNDLAGKVVNNLKGKSLDELMAEGEYWELHTKSNNYSLLYISHERYVMIMSEV